MSHWQEQYPYRGKRKKKRRKLVSNGSGNGWGWLDQSYVIDKLWAPHSPAEKRSADCR